MTLNKFSTLKRPIHEIPEFVLVALKNENLLEDFHARPPYQQNDYIGWIIRAKLEKTKMKRLSQMLEELRQGDEYMGMAHKSKKRKN
ncbi:MAG: YdeI/OmpD-associated family protein [Candidatus Riflebacteria bacterium]|nr:YdeI/OmpD-associated family protein [Candidatus Riflebacteria bacterium]